MTVPDGAEQAIVFLAPSTGGDFSTLRNAVRGRPGVFVRATQDLQAASQDRMRADAYLSDVKVTSQTDPKSLKERAQKSASVLGIKLDQACFDRPTDQQATCLTQHTEGMVLDDANASSKVAQLTSGSSGDLMNQLSYSTLGGAGIYSPYVGAIVDTARILASSAHRAFSVHSRPGAADAGYAQFAAERAAVVPRPEVGGGGGAAAGRAGGDAAAAPCESVGAVLCRKDGPGASG